ncbi:MAG: NADH-quinone oxidoreductase subunit J [Rhodocyclaceae bacterium]|nr:NADH-quinone oxidoreductase subunit J [Rhodocyclaceae bacterium]MBR4877284.1 NADH-quinone oxidoreductase subunit J [Rhodocyclaceae bacterium]
MEFKTLVFYFFSIILVLAALGVILARNPVYAVLSLVVAFIGASGVWMLLEAEFLAISLVLVYVGAVMVLFLFVVMMLDIDPARLREGFWRYLPLALLVGALLLGEMTLVLNGDWFQALQAPAAASAEYSNTQALGRVLYTVYAYPFELASLVLLIAMIAAVSLTHRKREGVKRVDPAQQVKVKRNERLRVVSMPVEKEEETAPDAPAGES